MFERVDYRVVRIDGDYAYLQLLPCPGAEDASSQEEKCVARALLPQEIYEGCRLAYEMLEYTLIGS